MPKNTIVETVNKSDDFKTFAYLLERTSLSDVFTGEHEHTVFLPTQEAFGHLGEEVLKALLSPQNQELLKVVLKYHIIKGRYDALDLEDMKEIKTINGEKLALSEQNGDIYVQNAKIATEDIMTKDGIIHIIDEVMIPKSIKI